ncbi:MAG: Gfo/Idh/MocA family oxidoreductase [Chloroflexi bacterium]|nr:Gfo/Idh/MocA family oxidoreductase [Chloroflexota bacterium]
MALGFAIVGTGMFASGRVMHALTRAQNCAPVAVVSRDRGRAAAFAEEHGIAAAYDDLGAALADRRVDAVWVTTPHNLHRPVVEAAAAARKHVLCEKPLATTVDDARAIVAACRRAGVALGAGFHLRHHPIHREVRRLVASGAAGPIMFAEAEWSLESSIAAASAWRRDPESSGGGIVTGTGVHAIDLLRFVLSDEVVSVSAIADAGASGAAVDTRAVAMLRFSRGTVGVVRCMRPVRSPANDLTIQGATGALTGRGTIDEATRGRLEAIHVEPGLLGIPAGADMYAAQANAFAGAAQRGDDPDASGFDGLAVTIITTALYESARTGRSVEVNAR